MRPAAAPCHSISSLCSVCGLWGKEITVGAWPEHNRLPAKEVSLQPVPLIIPHHIQERVTEIWDAAGLGPLGVFPFLIYSRLWCGCPGGATGSGRCVGSVNKSKILQQNRP